LLVFFFIKLRSLLFRITYDESNARNYHAIVVIEETVLKNGGGAEMIFFKYAAEFIKLIWI
jgi:hypothetical protein